MAVSTSASAVTLFDYYSENGRNDAQLYARLQQDALVASDVPAGVTTRSTLLRSAWIGLNLRSFDDWLAFVSGSFARRPTLRDLSLEYRGWPTRIEIGRFPEPFSIGGSIDPSDTLLMNRPSPTLLGPDYGFGIGTSSCGKNWGFSTGAFTREAGPTLAGRYPQNALTMRATWRPLVAQAGYLHLGVSGSLREMRKGTGVLLSGTAESSLVSGLTPHAALQTNTDHYNLLSGESAVRLGSTQFIGEYIRADVGGGVSWSGEYIEGAWSLTGERRGYSTRYGTVGGITPNRPVIYGGFGAWELAARWSRTDFRDGGGDFGRIASAGLNWYPVDPVRVSIGAERAHLELPDGSLRNGTIAQARFQLYFF